MLVSWIIPVLPTRDSQGDLTSNLASVRYRVLSPTREMAADAVQNQLITMAKDTPDSVVDRGLRADVIVFGKSFLPSNESIALRAKASGVRVIVDVCDNYYQHPELGAHYQAMSKIADQVVCSTSEMARVAGQYCAAAPVVIEDPYEGPRGEARFSPLQPMKLLWFGDPTNLGGLQGALGDLIEFSAGHAINLTVFTHVDGRLEEACRKINGTFGERFSMSAKTWSLAGQWPELSACDVVIIPSLQDAAKRVKSANRMVEALWAGRPVVAQPMPAYMEFDQWTPVRPTLSEGIRWLMVNQDRVPSLISQAQDLIAQRYAPAVLAGRWRDVIEMQRS